MINNNLTIFNNELFGEVRFIQVDGKPYAVGSDVAKALGYARPTKAIQDHCKGVLKWDMGVVTGEKSTGEDAIQNVKMSVIPEGDIYRLIIRSKLPSAEKFESWVFDEVLPQIRMTGGYIPVKEEDSEQEILAKALQIMNKTLEKKDLIIQQQQATLQEQQPKVEYHDAVLNTTNLVSITEIANDLGLTPQQLNTFLKVKGIQNKQYKDWKISKQYFFLIDEGYADYHIFVIGGQARQHLKWTERGRKWIVDLYNF